MLDILNVIISVLQGRGNPHQISSKSQLLIRWQKSVKYNNENRNNEKECLKSNLMTTECKEI